MSAATSHVGAVGALVLFCGLVPPEVRQLQRERQEAADRVEQERAASKALRRRNNRSLPRALRFRGVRQARVGTGPDDVLWRLP